MNPDLLMEKIEAGAVEIGPTDKNYKVYVTHDNGLDGKAYFQHFDVPHMERFVELLNAGKMRIGMPGYLYNMPYFVA